MRKISISITNMCFNFNRVRSYLYLFANVLFVCYSLTFAWNPKYIDHITTILFVIWIITGDYEQKIKKIFHSKIVLSFLLLLFVFMLGLLWTENLDDGYTFFRQRPLLLFIAPLMISMYQKRFIKYYLYGILASYIITAMIIFLSSQGFLNIRLTADEMPFINRNYLGTMFVFIFGILVYLFKFKNALKINNIFLFISIILISYVIIYMENRSTYMIIPVVLLILFIDKFKLNLKLLGIFSIFFMVFIYGLYSYNSNFKNRINSIGTQLSHFDMQKQIHEHDTSIRDSATCRLEFWYYAFKLGNNNPILGVGTGDTILELERMIGKKETDKLFATCLGNGSGQFNPHNLFLFFYMSFGIVGLVLLLWSIVVQFIYSIKSKYTPLIILVIVNFLFMFFNSGLFISVYYTPFYVFTFMTLYLMVEEKEYLVYNDKFKNKTG